MMEARVGGKGTGLAKRTFIWTATGWQIQTPDKAAQDPSKETVEAYQHLLDEATPIRTPEVQVEPKATPKAEISEATINRAMQPGAYRYYRGSNGRLRFHEVLLNGKHVDHYARLVNA